MIKLPYNKIELLTTLIGIEKKISVKKLKKVGEEIKAELKDRLPDDEKSINTIIAKQNGISVEALINSPNLKLLQSQYQDSILTDVVGKLETKLKLDNKEVWALLAGASGMLDSL